MYMNIDYKKLALNYEKEYYKNNDIDKQKIILSQLCIIENS